MASTPLTIFFIGLVALLATIGMFVDFGEENTRVLMAFAAATVWGLLGVSSFDVVVYSGVEYPTASEPILPLAYMGIALALVCAVFGFYFLAQAIGDSTGATEAGGLIDGP
jgi:hypothetical protein